MRSSRLVAILIELTRSRSTTVQGVADHHRVTPRTVQRDIAALRDMGVPLWTRPGPSGGIGLVEGWRSPITGMTGPELQSLIIGEAASRDLGLDAEFDAARLKMLTTTSAQDEAVVPAQERFLIDNERWFSKPERPAQLSAVAQAVWSARRLTIHYRRPGHDPSVVRRLLDPLGLVLKTDSWYLVAAHRRSLRTYRLSRITSAQVHDEEAQQPAEFSLADYWQQSRAKFEASVNTLPVRILIAEDSVGALRAAVPGSDVAAAAQKAMRSGDRLDVELDMERFDIALAQLSSVPGIEVVHPAELRRELFERGQELVARNGPPGCSRATRESTDPCR